ncbi:methyltransferase [Emericellopsis atlantica]|uniref:Methyltransferase n=1 Tax=Emericellopsis atlantica TaxID=2614577 RepID=A0A9P7ZNG6_9HYPO|nr:methyltransferase [Emericellopsis atlantica]KAG9254733.1 methyltransferase [Emericellopsis atlantica]
MDDRCSAAPCYEGPPTPSSTSGTAIAVGTSSDAAIIQSIEKGDLANVEDSDDTHSLTDSIRQHIVDGGLRYHAYRAGKYCFPNDDNEQSRENLKHTLTVHLCDGEYFFAPVHEALEDGAMVLDLGTGTGQWCIDVADRYPDSELHGMDLSPIQPDWVPENVQFLVDDIEHEAGWTYPENHFDFIHMRHTLHSVQNRSELWERVYSHLKPGGWFELQEFEYAAACDDDSCPDPYPWRQFCDYLGEAMAKLGSDMNGILSAEHEMRAAGLQKIHVKLSKCPVGPWAKKKKLQECGHILRDVVLMGLNGLARRPFRDGLHWTPAQIELHLVDVRKAITAEHNGLLVHHAYFPFRAIYGRKPLDVA